MSDTLFLLRDTLWAQRDNPELVHLPAGYLKHSGPWPHNSGGLHESFGWV